MMDDEIGRKLAAIEDGIRRRRSEGHPVDVPRAIPAVGQARLERACRTDACFVLGKLVARLGLCADSPLSSRDAHS